MKTVSRLITLGAGLAAFIAPVEAQGSPAASATRPLQATQYDTRQALEEQAREAEKSKRAGEAFLLRARLERGDFQEGDRIVVELEGAQLTRDTLQVRTGKTLQFPRMGELSLEGVLRSELTERVRQHLSRFLLSPVVRTTPLLPIAVLGAVNAPGFYNTPADVVLRDVIMRAGGPASAAELSKTVVKRGGEVIWNANDVSVALADGMTLDGLHLRAGDEVFVPQRKSTFSMTNVLAIVSSVIALTVAIVNLSR